MEIGQLLMILGQPLGNAQGGEKTGASIDKDVFAKLLTDLMKEDFSSLADLIGKLAEQKQFSKESDVLDDLVKKIEEMQKKPHKGKQTNFLASAILKDIALLFSADPELVQVIATIHMNQKEIQSENTVSNVENVKHTGEGIYTDIHASDTKISKDGTVENVEDHSNVLVVNAKKSEGEKSIDISAKNDKHAMIGHEKHAKTFFADKAINNVPSKVEERVKSRLVDVEESHQDTGKDAKGIKVTGKVIENKITKDHNNGQSTFPNSSSIHAFSTNKSHTKTTQVTYHSKNHAEDGIFHEVHQTNQVIAYVSDNFKGKQLHQSVISSKIQGVKISQVSSRGKYVITDPIEIVPITADEWENTKKDILADKEFAKVTIEHFLKLSNKNSENKAQVGTSPKGIGVSKGITTAVHVDMHDAKVDMGSNSNTKLSVNFTGIKNSLLRDMQDGEIVKTDNIPEHQMDTEQKVSNDKHVKEEKISHTDEINYHKHVATDVSKLSVSDNPDKQLSQENRIPLKTLNSLVRTVEIMKSKHKYPTYMAVKIDDSIVRMKLSFDVEKGEFLLEMMSDKDMAKTLHLQKHVLINALIEKDIHVRDVKVYVTNQSSMMGLRQDARHMNWSFMGHNGTWHSYKQQHEYVSWLRDIYSNAYNVPVMSNTEYKAPSSANKGAGINIYA